MAHEYSALLDIRGPEPDIPLFDLHEYCRNNLIEIVSLGTSGSVDGEENEVSARTNKYQNASHSKVAIEKGNKLTDVQRSEHNYTYDGSAPFVNAHPKNEWDMIRLLELAPGEFLSQIHCKLRHTYIPHEPYYGLSPYSPAHPDGEARCYEALSYTWGKPTDKQMIFVDGKRLEIWANLYTALQYIRKVDEPRTLWIDAICIDQSNRAERNSQVLRMAQIYRNASCVLVWLGEALKFHDAAVKALEAMGGARGEMILEPLSLNVDTGDCEVLRPRDPKALQDPLTLSMDEKLAVFVGFFLARPWWSRMWVVQEITLPPKAYLLCGTSVLEWDTIANMFQINEGFRSMAECGLQPELADVLISAQSLCTLRGHAQLAEALGFIRPSTTLGSLLAANSTRQCSDPRDMIYALLGLSSCPKAIVVDYSKTPRDVYIEAARVIITDQSNDSKTKTPSLDIIATTYRSVNESKLNLPSWVPDWSLKHELWSPVIPYLGYSKFNTMKNGPKLLEDPEIDKHGNLSVVSIKFDTVCHLSPKLDGEKGDHWDSSLWEPSRLDSIKYPTGERGIDAFWRSLLTDEGDRQHVRLLPEEMGIYRDEFLLWSGRQPLVSGGRKSAVYDILQEKLRGYVFAVTTKGFWGLVPQNTQVDDVVIVASGLSVPLVLTKCRPGEQPYELYRSHGAAYIHGIMDGELGDAIVKGELTEEVVQIA